MKETLSLSACQERWPPRCATRVRNELPALAARIRRRSKDSWEKFYLARYSADSCRHHARTLQRLWCEPLDTHEGGRGRRPSYRASQTRRQRGSCRGGTRCDCTPPAEGRPSRPISRKVYSCGPDAGGQSHRKL